MGQPALNPFPGTTDANAVARLEAKVDRLQTMLNTVLRERAKKEGEAAQATVEAMDGEIHGALKASVASTLAARL
eukprot:7375446-Prymnesium_polylepis.1